MRVLSVQETEQTSGGLINYYPLPPAPPGGSPNPGDGGNPNQPVIPVMQD